MSNKRWMRPEERAVEAPFLAVFRNRFHAGSGAVLKFRYSADERAAFFLDGEKIADGPERGTPQRWFFHSVEVPLAPGAHVLTCRLLVLGGQYSAYAQLSVRPGVCVDEESDLLGDWECQTMMGCTFARAPMCNFSYAFLLTDEQFNWLALEGQGGKWAPPAFFEDDRPLFPAGLPPMDCGEITAYRRDGAFFLFDDYVCAYGDYRFSGTGEVRLRWAEPGCDGRPVDERFRNGHKPGDPYPYFCGPGFRFRLTGGETVRWQDFWWNAGRTLEMTLYGDVKLESVHFYRTGYPWRLTRPLEIADDRRMTRLLARSWATLRACTHETFMDCPYYEQLQYISDSRFDMLALYEITGDDRLTRKALRQFAEGQYDSGMMNCRYPSRVDAAYRARLGEVYTMHIPSFTAFYIQMLHDFARRRTDDALATELLPSAERAAAYLASTIGDDGLLHTPGWNFIDWLDSWEAGVPPGCLATGGGTTLQLIFILSLRQLADLERHFGTAVAAERADALAEQLGARVRARYYRPESGCFAENDDGYCSEHAQVFALLALGERSVIPALRAGELDECGIAFSFYYLEACRIFGLQDLFAARRERYYETADLPGLRTMPELFPNGWWMRSDCHAWGAHFLYHQFATGNILDPIP
ncbi:hypothetical protein [uncultured Victivallis sp.]|uniref:alpha-L-rhamnosidase-related protein n=1 Tax=uncultured Victivallis sp. TaxID=354118 RepID=UPI0025915C33|nr:hypothetical protein [uncultured Victivallis sp.]